MVGNGGNRVPEPGFMINALYLATLEAIFLNVCFSFSSVV